MAARRAATTSAVALPATDKPVVLRACLASLHRCLSAHESFSIVEPRELRYTSIDLVALGIVTSTVLVKQHYSST
jgi:hypothetical protein